MKKTQLSQIIRQDDVLKNAMIKHYTAIQEQSPKLEEIKESMSLLCN